MTPDPECRPWMEQDEGPYHLDGEPFRQDLIEDRTGVPLRLSVRLVRDDGGPVVGAVIDLWHCDALGRYSGFPVPDDPDDDAGSAANSTERFLRGRQRTDERSGGGRRAEDRRQSDRERLRQFQRGKVEPWPTSSRKI